MAERYSFLAQRFGVDGAAFGGNGDKIIVQFRRRFSSPPRARLMQ